MLRFLTGLAIVVLLTIATILLVVTGISLSVNGDTAASDWLKWVSIVIVGLTGILSYLSSNLAHKNQREHEKTLIELKAKLDGELAERQNQFQAELAQRKNQLDAETADQRNKLDAQLGQQRNEVEMEIAKLKGSQDQQLAKRTARLEQFVSREYEDYEWLWKAAAEYFQLLETLQTGEFDKDGFKAALDNLRESPLHTLHVSENDRQIFFDFRAEATYVGGEAYKIFKDGKPNKSDTLKRCWEANKDRVYASYKALTQEFSTRLSES